MINIAVIGAGAISGFHIEGYLAFPGRCRIVSVADIDRAKAERQIERYHLDAVAADDIGAMVSGPGADLASVCTPPGTHAEIAARLLDAGVHTLHVLAAIETGSADVLVDGHQGRGTLEIITAIYKAAMTGTRVTLPLDDGDPFCTRDGLLAAAPRFHEKTVSVPGFADNQITVTGARR